MEVREEGTAICATQLATEVSVTQRDGMRQRRDQTCGLRRSLIISTSMWCLNPQPWPIRRFPLAV